jgi:protein-L-isoaspartate(D-aspartate) O-methyltransferase
MRAVPRHMFVPENMQSGAHDDSPLPIGYGQTISQPYIVAYMTEVLEPHPGMKVLEIGAGSGYQAAVLAHLGCAVYTVEIVAELAGRAKKLLSELGYGNISVKQGDGYLGWPEESPFDAILAAAAPESVPARLIEQLKDGGKMIIPVGAVHAVQTLKLITKRGGGKNKKDLLPVRFVPMV